MVIQKLIQYICPWLGIAVTVVWLYRAIAAIWTNSSYNTSSRIGLIVFAGFIGTIGIWMLSGIMRNETED